MSIQTKGIMSGRGEEKNTLLQQLDLLAPMFQGTSIELAKIDLVSVMISASLLKGVDVNESILQSATFQIELLNILLKFLFLSSDNLQSSNVLGELFGKIYSKILVQTLETSPLWDYLHNLAEWILILFEMRLQCGENALQGYTFQVHVPGTIPSRKSC
jgi:hypothetical protein